MTKHILNDETRKALLGYVPFSADCKIPFTPDEFANIKDESYRPIFEIRSFTQAELSQLKHNSQSLINDASSEKLMSTADKNLSLVRECVCGWKNLFDVGTREEIEFVKSPEGGCEEKVFQSLPVWLKRSILEFVKKISGLSEPEELSIK
jgi:hypothetical protein